MSTENFGRLDMENEGPTDSENQKKRGCYVSLVRGTVIAVLGFIVLLLVILIAYFAGEKVVTYACDDKTTSIPSSKDDNLTNTCARLAASGNVQICNACYRTPKDELDIRLPSSLVPLVYDVNLRPNIYGPDPSEFKVTGSVKIQLQCNKDTFNVSLHINELDVIENSVTVHGGNTDFIVLLERDAERQFLILRLNKKLLAGEIYNVSMSFWGHLTTRLSGLYISSYQHGNTTSYVATTQFEPTDARKALPCFDEPALKAKFRITLERQESKTALSNMPVAYSEKLDDLWVADHFEITPKMPTYLLAFIVGDFKYMESLTKRNIEYRVWSRPQVTNQAEYALGIGDKVLTFFEDYFKIHYPLPKQDMIAVPDFPYRAMENWGLIVYRESTMLYDNKATSEHFKQVIAYVIAHEVAHQWFGNIVSPIWWDELWLNEGFATYMGYFGVYHVETDWKMFEEFIVGVLHVSFKDDAVVSSHPLFVPVERPSEIAEVFDSISYQKGAAVIRMAKFFLGEEAFQKGLTNYLRKHQYGSATRNDLWVAWGDQTSLDVKSIMDTWVLQMNYPVVSIERTSDGMFASQTRFLLDHTATDPGVYTSPFGYKWDIPLTYTYEDEKHLDATKIHWMYRITDSQLPRPGEDKWILANVQQQGYYRVNYDDHNWRQLIRQLRTNYRKIPTTNRAQILNDAWNLARAGLLDMRIALDTLDYLSAEREYIPWKTATVELDFVSSMLQRNKLFGPYRKFIARTVNEYFDELTMNNTGASHTETLTRSLISGVACHNGIQSCISEAQLQYRKWMQMPDQNTIDPDLRSVVYCTAIQHGGIEEWEFGYGQYKVSDIAAEKDRLRSALACSRETWILSSYLQKTLMPEEIRKQDTISTIVSISKNPVGQPLVWDFVRSKWTIITEEYIQVFGMKNLLVGITNTFNTKWDLQQLEDLKVKQPDMGSGTRAFQLVTEKTKSNIEWMENNIDIISNWLREKHFL
ncbi:hypothetical protein ScPMuIL_002926 [Solemya velum]